MPSSSLPIGWEDRDNTMSEKDMKLGGAAAKRFATASSTNAYAGSDDFSYQTSDQVRAFYYSQQEHIQQQQQQQQQNDTSNEALPSEAPTPATAVLPTGWEHRQKHRQLEAKQHGVFAARQSTPAASTVTDSTGPEVALFRVATYSLQSLADTLEQQSAHGSSTAIPSPDQAAFADAVRRVTAALAKR